jgi:hypothetical protein
MGVEAVTAVECVDHFLRFSSRLKGKSWRKWRHIFLLSTVWSLWNARNKAIFDGKMHHNIEIIDMVKCLSWFWIGGKGRTKHD